MADYTQNEDYSAKDALNTGDPEKLILGSDIDSEFAEIQTAIASKLDSTDIASQAQAETGTNNTTVMTPLRVAQAIAGSGTAGLPADLAALDDPNDDRILFWDDSASALTWLDLGTGLSITGTTIAADDSAIDHDSLSGFVANEHIDHSAVTLTAGEGLTGGGTIAASRTFDFDFAGLTQETTIDETNDLVAFYDNSASAHRKVPIYYLVGDDLGDGKFYRSSAQSITSTEATFVFNAAEYNNLTRGTFSTSTGEYTVGSDAARILIAVGITLDSAAEGGLFEISVQVNGVDKAYSSNRNRGTGGVSDLSVQCVASLSLAATDVVRVRVTSSSTKNSETGTDKAYVSIVELS